jgi:hypothetical protein
MSCLICRRIIFYKIDFADGTENRFGIGRKMHLPENSFAQLIRTTGIVFYLLRTPLEIK